MASFTKTVVSFIALMLFVAGTVATSLGVFKSSGEKVLADDYVIASEVLNTIAVMFLLYLTSINDSISATYKFTIILLLVGGLIIEIYLTMYSENKDESIASYVFITLNFLVRAFFLIEMVQGEWVSPFKQAVLPVQQAVKETIVPPIIRQSQPKQDQDSSSRDLISKWDKLKNILKSKSEGLNIESEKEAWRTVVKPAKDEGRSDVMTVLREAVEKLKDGEGNSIPLSAVDAVGGKRARK